MKDRSNPAACNIGANSCEPAVPMKPAIISNVSSPR
jgi:hypothetical protein